MKKFTRFNPNLWPQDGRFFIDEDGVKHKADQWEHLAVRLATYRKKAGKPPGDPHAEIEAQVCARQPGYCRETQQVPSTPREVARQQTSPRYNPGQLTKRVVRWLLSMLKARRAGGAKRVTPAEARRRAEICARCPMQRGLSQACGSCTATKKQAAEVLMAGARRVPQELNGCVALGEDTSISVYIEQDPAKPDGLPAECWRK